MLTRELDWKRDRWPAVLVLVLMIATGRAQTAIGVANRVPIPGLSGTLTAAKDAPITIIVFSDFESFLCARSAAVLKGVMSGSEDVRLVFKHAPAATNPNSMLAHEAALAAGAQGKFWEMHDLLFDNQSRLNRADLTGYAKSLGLNVSTFQHALDRHTYRPVIERDLIDATGLGVTATPTFFVNGRRLVGPQSPGVLKSFVDSVRDALPKDPEKSEALATSGSAPVIHVEHAPTKGPASASITFVEFSDLECSYCVDAARTVDQLIAAYPGQIRLFFKHYPLATHKHSLLAHQAALAAGDQGKFWEMHNLIFASQDKLAREDLIAKAKQLDLDMARFTKDLDSHRFSQVVESDLQEGDRLGVDGTPFFFVNGHAISGAVGLDDFKRVIDLVLREIGSANAK